MAARPLMFFLASSVLGTSAAQAQCIKPEPDLEIPDGETVSREEMLEAHAAFKSYDGRVKTFVDCLNAQEEMVLRDRAGEASAEALQAIAQRYAEQRDKVIDEEEALAARFNAQIRAFKGRESGQ